MKIYQKLMILLILTVICFNGKLFALQECSFVYHNNLSPKSTAKVLLKPLSQKFYELLDKHGVISIMTVCHYNMERSVLSYHLIENAVQKKSLGEFVRVNSSTPFSVLKSRGEVIYLNERQNKQRTFDSISIKLSKLEIETILNLAGIMRLNKYQQQMTRFDIENANMIIIFDENLDKPRIFEDTKFRIFNETSNPEANLNKLVQIQTLIPGFEVWNFKQYKDILESEIIPAIEEAVNQYKLGLISPNSSKTSKIKQSV